MRTVIVAGLMLLCAAPAQRQSRPPRELGNFPVVVNTVSTGEVLVSWQPVQKTWSPTPTVHAAKEEPCLE